MRGSLLGLPKRIAKSAPKSDFFSSLLKVSDKTTDVEFFDATKPSQLVNAAIVLLSHAIKTQ